MDLKAEISANPQQVRKWRKHLGNKKRLYIEYHNDMYTNNWIRFHQWLIVQET